MKTHRVLAAVAATVVVAVATVATLAPSAGAGRVADGTYVGFARIDQHDGTNVIIDLVAPHREIVVDAGPLAAVPVFDAVARPVRVTVRHGTVVAEERVDLSVIVRGARSSTHTYDHAMLVHLGTHE
jgi:hypothetical protein